MQTSLLSFFSRTPKGSPQQPKGSPKTPLGPKVSNGKGDQNSPVSSKSANVKAGINLKYPPGKEIEGFYNCNALPPPAILYSFRVVQVKTHGKAVEQWLTTMVNCSPLNQWGGEGGTENGETF